MIGENKYHDQPGMGDINLLKNIASGSKTKMNINQRTNQ